MNQQIYLLRYLHIYLRIDISADRCVGRCVAMSWRPMSYAAACHGICHRNALASPMACVGRCVGMSWHAMSYATACHGIRHRKPWYMACHGMCQRYGTAYAMAWVLVSIAWDHGSHNVGEWFVSRSGIEICRISDKATWLHLMQTSGNTDLSWRWDDELILPNPLTSPPAPPSASSLINELIS